MRHHLVALFLLVGTSLAVAQEAIVPGATACQVMADVAQVVVRARSQGLPALAASAVAVHRYTSPQYPAATLWPVAFQVYIEAPAEASPEQVRAAVSAACLSEPEAESTPSR